MKKLKDLSTDELHAKELELARDLSAVKLEVLHRSGFRRGPIGDNEQIRYAQKYPGMLFDHAYALNSNGIRLIITEPYDIGRDDLRRLLDDPQFIRITANSMHFPGKTIGVHFNGGQA